MNSEARYWKEKWADGQKVIEALDKRYAELLIKIREFQAKLKEKKKK